MIKKMKLTIEAIDEDLYFDISNLRDSSITERCLILMSIQKIKSEILKSIEFDFELEDYGK